tara:strand:+ start:479 stop:715 length:237 start_codon:yes stop_codon:yes gene_type:complete
MVPQDVRCSASRASNIDVVIRCNKPREHRAATIGFRDFIPSNIDFKFRMGTPVRMNRKLVGEFSENRQADSKNIEARV